jgi:predicted enzyme related to lactoylglutathione lyase
MQGLTGVVAALPAQDMDRARAFYAEMLGLQPSEVVEGGSGLRYVVSGGQFLLFTSSGAPSGTHTQMSFIVDDADAAAAVLHANGVTFESVEGLDQVEGIATMGTVRGGWFKDSEGNLLGLVQELT